MIVRTASLIVRALDDWLKSVAAARRDHDREALALNLALGASLGLFALSVLGLVALAAYYLARFALSGPGQALGTITALALLTGAYRLLEALTRP
jgi:hypothetical protein